MSSGNFGKFYAYVEVNFMHNRIIDNLVSVQIKENKVLYSFSLSKCL